MGRQDEQQRPLQVAFEQEAAFVETREKQRAGTIPLLIARVSLKRVPDAAGLHRQFRKTADEFIDRRLGVAHEAVAGFAALQGPALQRQPLVEPVGDLQ